MPAAGYTFPDKKAPAMARRLEKLKQIEAAKAPEERLVNREWDDEVQRKISVLNAIRQRTVKRQFIELAVCEHVKICETVAEAEAFFTKGGPTFTCKILKMFTEAFALSSNGQITDVPAVRSITCLLVTLFSATQNSGNPIDREVRRNILMWVQSDLAVRGLAHHQQRTKMMAMPQDVSTFLRAFFDTKYLTATQYTTRNALNFVLCVNMMLDCSNRISELTRPAFSNEVWEAYKKERKEKMFTWRRVELWAFPGVDGRAELCARLTFRDLKNTGQQGNKTKVIPIRLLPLHMAAEDTMRWLLILGLIDGVFQGITSWADLEDVQPSEHGTRIPVKQSMLNTPVFRQPRYKPNDSSLSLLEPDPMRASHFVQQLKVLSRYCGLQSPMLPGVLRRGSAYLLALNTSHEERCARMGHDNKDTVYWGAYRNDTSTIDFQAIRHGVDRVDVSRMSSIYLGKAEAPPTAVSEQGVVEISQDSELRQLLQKESDLIDQVVRDFGSLSAARARGSSTVSKHAAIRRQYQERERVLLSKKFKEEYQQHFETHELDVVQSTAPIEPAYQNTFYDSFLDAEDAEYIPIDPALLEDIDDVALDLGNMLVAENQSEEMQVDDVQMDSGIETNTTSLHSAGSAARNHFGLRVVAKHSLFTGLDDIIYNQPEGLSASRFADVCVEKFNHLHAADKFYPDQEPTPGTLSCNFCGIDLIGKDHNAHIRPCGLTAMAHHILEDLDHHQTLHPPSQKCGMTGFNGARGCSAKYKLTRDTKSAAHFTSHCSKRHRDANRQYICNDHARSFSSWEDFRIHRITQHAASTVVLPVDEKTGHPRPEVYLFWCKICQKAISRTEEDEDHHYMQHLDDVHLSLSEHGFSGVHVSVIWWYPCFCPFCLYDGDAGFSTQFADFNSPESFAKHAEKHLRDLNDDVVMACPAATDTANGIRAVCDHTEPMGKEDLIAHLTEEHGLKFDKDKTVFKPKGKRARPGLEENDLDEDI